MTKHPPLLEFSTFHSFATEFEVKMVATLTEHNQITLVCDLEFPSSYPPAEFRTAYTHNPYRQQICTRKQNWLSRAHFRAVLLLRGHIEKPAGVIKHGLFPVCCNYLTTVHHRAGAKLIWLSQVQLIQPVIWNISRYC